jgi:Flp pilus assembly protein TadD
VTESLTVQRAYLLIATRRYDEALRILAGEPGDAAARRLSAIALLSKEQLQPALAEVERSLALEPDAAESHSLRSGILLTLGRIDDALAASREAVRLEPREPFAYASLAHAAIADLLRFRIRLPARLTPKKWKVADESVAELLRLAPEWSESHSYAGTLALLRSRPKIAEAYFRDAIRLDPTDAGNVNDLAIALVHQNRQKEAVATLGIAARTDPSMKMALDNLYRETSHYVGGWGGTGLDRLDLVFLPTIFISIAITGVIYLGYVHPPAIVSAASLGLTLVLGIAYSVLDYIRNRARLNALSQGTRTHYRRGFFRVIRGVYGFLVYMAVSLGIPALVVASAASAVGLPGLVQLALVIAIVGIWAWLGIRLWRRRVRGWLGIGPQRVRQ